MRPVSLGMSFARRRAGFFPAAAQPSFFRDVMLMKEKAVRIIPTSIKWVSTGLKPEG